MSQDNMQIASTILQQLGGSGKLKAMTGAKQFCAIDSGLSFKLPARFAKDGINYIKIQLNSMDLYDVEYGKIYKFNYQVIKTDAGIYADMLKGCIADATGLALSL